ncbi:hypothetical protein CaCOL14_013432 [Colletotrichum acutatum]
MPSRDSARWERPVVPLVTPEHKGRHSANLYDGVSGRDGRQRSPSISAELEKGNFKTPDRLNAKDITFNEPTAADVVEFRTSVDTLMKAIQERPMSYASIKGVPENDQVKAEHESPNLEADHRASPPTSSPIPAEVVNAPKTKKFVCDIDSCGKSFDQGHHLDNHKRAHTGEKPYQCTWLACESTFSQPGNLQTHMRRHAGEKPFQCKQCPASFPHRGNLQSHTAIHTGEKPFVCKLDQCNKGFTQRGNLKAHQNKHHTKAIAELAALMNSTPDVEGLDDEQRETYRYLEGMFKNSNRGVKGRVISRDARTMGMIACGGSSKKVLTGFLQTEYPTQ